jgi:arylsulfatase A-like enzyme
MEGGIRVPLIISGPGINSSKEINIPVSGSDLLPTITDLAGQNKVIFDDIDGGSLKQIILGEDINFVEREVDGIFFHVPYKNGIALKRPHSAIRRGDYKLIKFQDNGQILLYNIVDDIKEENNLLATNKKIARNLEKILDNYLNEVDAPKWQEGITWKNKPLKEFNSYH